MVAKCLCDVGIYLLLLSTSLGVIPEDRNPPGDDKTTGASDQGDGGALKWQEKGETVFQ